jgi:hypothetical protein
MAVRRALVPFAVPLLFGIVSLINVLTRPRVGTYVPADVVQLIGTGMCFGVALVGLILMLRGNRRN